eukprot:TRINITY_DN6801_c0_g1_i3.p1 TRINITY_DN6801_c0_g1~~TRINITY_DN6801_c0_g1_i3.p1  ORF type:complete len:250 (+),score=47.49 TRINITY_DN6801_c0_g1_i3:585-1334(+)
MQRILSTVLVWKCQINFGRKKKKQILENKEHVSPTLKRTYSTLGCRLISPAKSLLTPSFTTATTIPSVSLSTGATSKVSTTVTPGIPTNLATNSTHPTQPPTQASLQQLQPVQLSTQQVTQPSQPTTTSTAQPPLPSSVPPPSCQPTTKRPREDSILQQQEQQQPNKKQKVTPDMLIIPRKTGVRVKNRSNKTPTTFINTTVMGMKDANLGDDGHKVGRSVLEAQKKVIRRNTKHSVDEFDQLTNANKH